MSGVLHKIFTDNWPRVKYVVLQRLPPSVALATEAAVEKSLRCRTEALGFAQYRCEDCGAMHKLCFSCKSRFCASCGVASQYGKYGARTGRSSARAALEESLLIERELGDKWGITFSLAHLGGLALEEDDLCAARAHVKESLIIGKDMRDKWGPAVLLLRVASLAVAEGATLRAVSLSGASEHFREEIDSPMLPNMRPRYEREVVAARAALGDDAAFDAAWAEGSAMTMERTIELAIKSNAVRT